MEERIDELHRKRDSALEEARKKNWLKRMFAAKRYDKECCDVAEQLIRLQERNRQSNNLAVMPRQTFRSGYAVSALCKGSGVMD
ncbi:hypothetical protein TYRP_016921 [Tyrophagus putrescentiae]|nr:hypothetical protein TYRP_016921 [Tyrophagus putrescentiae]